MGYYVAVVSWLSQHWQELSPLRRRAFLAWLPIMREHRK